MSLMIIERAASEEMVSDHRVAEHKESDYERDQQQKPAELAPGAPVFGFVIILMVAIVGRHAGPRHRHID